MKKYLLLTFSTFVSGLFNTVQDAECDASVLNTGHITDWGIRNLLKVYFQFVRIKCKRTLPFFMTDVDQSATVKILKPTPQEW